MEDRVLIAWGILLGVAYVLTLAVLPVLFGVIRAANRIARNAVRAVPAAVGILNNTAAIEGLKTTEQVGGEILNTAQGLVGAASSIEAQLSEARM